MTSKKKIRKHLIAQYQTACEMVKIFDGCERTRELWREWRGIRNGTESTLNRFFPGWRR